MLQVSFIMIYLIYKISVLLKITIILKYFLRSKQTLIFLKNNKLFSQHIMMESSRLEEENIIKNVKNFYRLEKLKRKRNN